MARVADDNTNGDVYEGDFKKGEFTGSGRFVRKDGARYDGEFRNWLFHGRGRFTDNTNTWEGTFVDGSLEGQGKATEWRGTYEGEFKSGQFHGQGKLRQKNGDVYEGAFANGMFEGQGTLTYAKPRPDGRKQDSGIWQFGSFPHDGERKRRDRMSKSRCTRRTSCSTRRSPRCCRASRAGSISISWRWPATPRRRCSAARSTSCRANSPAASAPPAAQSH